MTDLRALLAELARRDQLRDAIHETIAARFEILKVPTWAREGGGAAHTANVPRVRRVLVYEATAAALEVPVVTNDWCRRVHAVACSLGAVPAAPHNRRVYLGMKPRLKSPRPVSRMPRAEFERLQREWREQLAADGFEDIEAPQGEIKRESAFDPARAEINEGYLRKAREFYWRDLRIWHEHAICGLSVREIVAKLGLGRWVVQDAITRLRAAWPKTGHPEHDQETSADDRNDDD